MTLGTTRKRAMLRQKRFIPILAHQNVKIYKDAVVLLDLSKTYGSTWSNYLDMDAVYADLERAWLW